MQAETCSWYTVLFNYILCNKVVLDCKIIYFIDYWKHNGYASTDNLLVAFDNLLVAFRKIAKSDY